MIKNKKFEVKDKNIILEDKPFKRYIVNNC
jgi:hypothetical protein